MLPCHTMNNVSDTRRGNLEYLSEVLSFFPRLISIPDLNYLNGFQFRTALLFSFWCIEASFEHHISSVICISSLRQMTFVKAGRIITAMKCFKVFIEAIRVHNPKYYSVGELFFSVPSCLAVAFRISAIWPFDTFIGFYFDGFDQVLNSGRLLSGHFGSSKADLSFGLAANTAGPFQF